MKNLKLTQFFTLFLFLILSAPFSFAETYQQQDFGDWHTGIFVKNNNNYIRLWTTIPGTTTEFEIFLSQNQGFRYYEPEEQLEITFTRLIDPEIYKNYYKSADEVKKVGYFSLDEVIYPVDLESNDTSGELETIVEDIPDNFLTLLSACNILMFRQVSGINYMIPLNGFKEALAYANSLRNNYDDPSRHPCYPLVRLKKS